MQQHLHLLGMEELSAKTILAILAMAKDMKKILVSGQKKTTHLQGKSVVTLFYENSTRTRLSFEMAAKFMGASVGHIGVSGSSINKGETLHDTALTIDAMATDFIIMRHPSSGAAHLMAKQVNASVINAGDGMHEHPTQCLLDLFTIQEKRGGFSGLEVAILGDITHSRVARSNIIALKKLGANVRVAGPSTMVPKDIACMGAVRHKTVLDACTGADVIMTLRLQLERMQKALFPSAGEYARYYGLTDAAFAKAQADAFIMHPGPYNHGKEMPSHLRYGEASVVDEQVTNGVACRMAVLHWLNTNRNANPTQL